MYRRVFNVLAVISLFGMLAAPVVQAQSSMLVANIPFQFNVGKAVLPSGEYKIKPVNPSTFLIQSKDGRQPAIANTIGVSSSTDDLSPCFFQGIGAKTSPATADLLRI